MIVARPRALPRALPCAQPDAVPGRQPCGGALVRIEMEFEPIIDRDQHRNVAKQYPSGIGFAYRVYAVPVAQSESIGMPRTHVNMGQRPNHPPFERNLRPRSLDENARCARMIARRAFRRVDTQLQCITLGQLHLIYLSRRSDDANLD